MIQSQSKYTSRKPSMLFGLDRLLSAYPLAYYVCPTKAERQQRYQLLQSLCVNHVRFLKPKPSTLQTSKQCFDLPTFRIIVYRLGRILRPNKDQVFSVGKPHPTNPHLKPPDASSFLQDQPLIQWQSSKQPTGFNQFSSPIGYLSVVTNANAEIYPLSLQPSKPSLSDKFAIRAQIKDRTNSKQTDELRDYRYAFLGVGIAFFVKDHPQHRYRNSLVNDPEHEQIQRGLAELPNSSIQSQHPRGRYTNQRDDQNGEYSVADLEEAKKSLNAFIMRVGFGPTSKNRSNLGKIDRANLNQSNEKLCQEVDPSLVPSYIFSKSSLKRANRGHRDFSFQDTSVNVLDKDKGSVAFYAFSKIIFCPVQRYVYIELQRPLALSRRLTKACTGARGGKFITMASVLRAPGDARR
jgi:hypothetical protein